MTPDWLSFFSTIAQVAVTAFSVMFLSMQVKSSAWRGSRLLSVSAVAALVELFVPLLAALITGMASHPWRLGALLASALGLTMVIVHSVAYQLDKHKEQTTRFDRTQAWGAWLSLIVYLTVGISAALPTPVGLHLLAGTCVWLLLSGSFEAWWLLEPKGMNEPKNKSSSRAAERSEEVTGQVVGE